MPRIIKQALAEQDLVEIWLYTFNEWGEQQADKYLDDLNAAITLLADQPLASRERTELEPPVRIHHHGHHLIVYLESTEMFGAFWIVSPTMYEKTSDNRL